MPPAKKTPTLRQKKVTRAKAAGYTGAKGSSAAAAQASVTRQYGLVKNEAGKWVQPDKAFLVRQMEAAGYGPEFQASALNAGTPLNIGGARWISGKEGVNFTGERSDAAKRNPGAAYGAENQVAYTLGSGRGKSGSKGGGKGKPKGRGKGGNKGRPEEKGFGPGGETAAGDQMYSPYAEADTTTTGMSRAQGKAYAASRAGMGGAREGQTYAREKSPAEESQAGAKKKGKGPKKAKPRRSPASRNRNKGRTGRAPARAKKK